MEITSWTPSNGVDVLSSPPRLRTGFVVPELVRATRIAAPLDVLETDEALIVRVDMPGYAPEAIDVEIEDGHLHIRAQQPSEQAENVNVLVRERFASAVARRVKLPKPVDADGVVASCQHGVLTITMPKHAQARKRVIQVKTEV